MSKILHNLFLTLIPSFFIISMAIESNDTRYPDCPSYKCGDVSIGYPCWTITDQTSTKFCGYQGLGMNCSNVEGEYRPMIPLGDDWYHVRNITNTSIIIADNNFVNNNLVDTGCLRVNHTIDLEYLPLNFSTRNLNLSFHFNCSGYFPDYATHIPCMDSGSKRSYVYVIDEDNERFNWDCDDNEVVTTVLDVFRPTNNNGVLPWGEYARALINGFELNWSRLDDCDKCELSKGRCGYNHNTREFLCFCSNGTTTTDHCNKDLVEKVMR